VRRCEGAKVLRRQGGKVRRCRGGTVLGCKVPKCKSAKVRRCQIAKVARRRGAGVVRCRDARCRDARCRDAEMLERWGAGVPRVFRRGIEVVNRQVCSKNADISENPSVDERLPITGSGKARKSAPFGRELRPEEAPPDPVLGCSPSWVAHRFGLLTRRTVGSAPATWRRVRLLRWSVPRGGGP
jgi:hypothetical protein